MSSCCGQRTIFGLSAEALSSSIGGGGDGKYVLKAGDSMQGDLVMEHASIDVQDGGITVAGAMSSVLLRGGAGLRVQDGGGMVIADGGGVSVDGKVEVKGSTTTGS